MSPPPVGIGVIGLGLGARMTLPWMLGDDRFEVRAAADPRPEAREAFERGLGGSASAELEPLLEREDVDLVYVATPHYLHAEHALAAVEHGKHVLVEKPLERSTERARQIGAAARRQGVYAFYGHTHASDPVIRATARAVATGTYGELGLILTYNYNDLLIRPRADWELDPVRSGGSPWIQGAHQVDVARFIAGSPVSEVSGWSRSLNEERVVAGSHAALLGFASGAAAIVAFAGYGNFDTAELSGWVAETGGPRPPSTHQATHDSYLERRNGEQAEPDQRNQRRIGLGTIEPARPLEFLETFGETIVSCAEADLRPTPHGLVVDSHGRRRTEEVAPVSGRQVMLREIFEALTGDIAPSVDCDWAAGTVAVLEKMEASA